MAVVAYIGRSGSGKTYLAQKHARAYWQRFRYRSLVLDINSDQAAGWGAGALVVTDREAWLARVRDPATRNVMVFCDDATMTVNRAPELVDLFTRLSRRGRRLHVLGHGNVNFTPLMRQQVTELFLWRAPLEEAREWAQLFTDPALLEATGLDFLSHEYLWATMGRPARRVAGVGAAVRG